MTDLDPEIWNNPTLGENTANRFADEMEGQAIEDRAAEIEGRDPLRVERIHRYPGSDRDNVIANSYDSGLRKLDANGNPGPGEFGQVNPDSEPENPGYEKDEPVNGQESEFDGTEPAEPVGNDGVGTPVESNPETVDDGYTDTGA